MVLFSYQRFAPQNIKSRTVIYNSNCIRCTYAIGQDGVHCSFMDPWIHYFRRRLGNFPNSRRPNPYGWCTRRFFRVIISYGLSSARRYFFFYQTFLVQFAYVVCISGVVLFTVGREKKNKRMNAPQTKSLITVIANIILTGN
jgi:hypothetical protein